jgi:predicted YcjX-like family ATPase
MHSQAACPEGVCLEKQKTNGSEIQARFKSIKNSILKPFYKVHIASGRSTGGAVQVDLRGVI